MKVEKVLFCEERCVVPKGFVFFLLVVRLAFFFIQIDCMAVAPPGICLGKPEPPKMIPFEARQCQQISQAATTGTTFCRKLRGTLVLSVGSVVTTEEESHTLHHETAAKTFATGEGVTSRNRQQTTADLQFRPHSARGWREGPVFFILRTCAEKFAESNSRCSL